ncbi:hypothetical protein [Pseudarthrobacter oxydans]|uniref:hypothetical protein n=1 Tax=Pseudarthrobacter oxydans TaxID=1671 RepID=UPI0027AAC41C|nr:hypothetical protein QMY03_01885 [Arthrobacter sp. KFRI-F3372]
MCYSSSKDFGWGIRKESDSKPEAKHEAPAETPEKPVKAQDFTFWAFPNWRKTRTPGTRSAERSKERV